MMAGFVTMTLTSTWVQTLAEEENAMTDFKCSDCGAAFRLAQKPRFCPYCASPNVIAHGKALETARKLIAECNEKVEKLEVLWSEYVALQASYELNMLTLRTYKKRGIITDDDMPCYKKKSLKESLAEYRKKKGGAL